jgi:hypothetical protein
MNFAEGDRVLVNLAPFIGSARHSKDSVACEILAVTATEVQVRPEPPCRSLLLWVDSRWIDRKLEACRVRGQQGPSVSA